MAGKKQVSEAKGARKSLPKKSWRSTILNVVLLMVWVFAVIIASQFLVGYLMLWILGAEKLGQPVWMAVYSAVVYVLAMALIMCGPRIIRIKRATEKGNKEPRVIEKVARPRANREELGLRGLPTWTDIGLAPAGFIVYLILAAGLVALFSVFPWFDAEQAQDVGFNTYIAGFDRILAFLTLVVVAPIAEEIIFRGWLYGKMRAKFNEKVSDLSSMIISIFLVSLLFGIVHRQWNVGVNVFAMSVVLCGLREITGTIYAGILLHMLKNGVAFYLLYVRGGVL
ncbi:CPBP family intramembrane metalloprotease [Candidatus Saccharibacteria bacterium]|nr:CPBP family intramembrane metalloprotease [Candidatus Saccharibacteria bacterium]